MRICSLLPSATEIVCALGLENDLVGVSHECDYPPAARSKPVLTRSRIDHSGRSSAEIDSLVSSRLHDHQGIYALDEDLLAKLKPDLILTQELCEVCAVSYEQVQKAVRALHGEQTLLSLEPNDIAGIFETIGAVGVATKREAEAVGLVANLQARLQELARTSAARSAHPRIACLEWIDPPFSGGHWVPEMVEIAGGVDTLASTGDRSRRISWAEVAAAEPEVMVLMPCGFDVAGTVTEYQRTSCPADWAHIPAFASGQIYAVDANAYFSRPGPRIVRGIEILAEIIDASESGTARRDGWTRIPA
jgi:iron complex transport system substrate-binding protein